MTKLKPCPFCGDKSIIQHQGNRFDGYIWWSQCRGCEIEGPRGFTKRKAIKDWNRRADGKMKILMIIFVGFLLSGCSLCLFNCGDKNCPPQITISRP